MRTAQLEDANLSGAQLRGALYLEQASFDRIEWNADTSWPPGFEPPPSTPAPF
ncbi:hypothetical protein [Rhodococcus sp. NBC_00297]|uniref:hypothetical protein n=1 Tax=Rhodococcus sp. NBC_00297 TaxID=2976005 RepID=UPI003FA7AAC9